MITTWLSHNWVALTATILGLGSFYKYIVERKKRKFEENMTQANALKIMQEAYDTFSKDITEMYNTLSLEHTSLKKIHQSLKLEYIEIKNKCSEMKLEMKDLLTELNVIKDELSDTQQKCSRLAPPKSKKMKK